MKMSTECKQVRKRRVFSLKFKLHVLDRIKKGERPAHVARSLGLNESTVRSIYVNEKKIRTSVGLGCPMFASHAGRCRPKILEKMEIELNAWITSRLEKSDPPRSVDTTSVKQKALSIYNTLKEQGETPTKPHFAASSGWFERFRKRFLIRTTNIKDEIMPDPKNDNDTEEFCTDQNSMSPKMKEEIISDDENDSYIEEILENLVYNNVLEQEKGHEKRKQNNGRTNKKEEIMSDPEKDSYIEELYIENSIQNELSSITNAKEEIISDNENDSYTAELLENHFYNDTFNSEEKGNEKRKQNNVLIADIQQLQQADSLPDMPHLGQAQRCPEQILPDVQMLPVNTFETNKIDKELGSFTLKGLRTGLDLAKQLELYFLNEDPCIERRTKFKIELHSCLAVYTKIYSNLTQLKITDFFSKYRK